MPIDEPRKPKPRPISQTGAGQGRRPVPARPKPGAPASSYMNPAYQTAANQQNFKDYANAGTDSLGAASSDPWANMTPDEYFAALMGMGGVNGAGGSGGSGGGYGGGGGGGGSGRAGDPDPMGWNAIANEQAINKGYAEMLAALDAKKASIGEGFDARTGALTGARDQGAATLQGILQGLGAATTGASQAVQGTYAQGDAQLAQLMNEYSQMASARQPGMNQTLQAFGAAPAAVSNGNSVQDMITAQRANLARVGQADQALLANRGAVQAGLNSDVSTQRSQQFDALMGKLLADRQVADQQAAAERAQLAMQQSQAVLAAQQAEQARKAGYQ